MGGGPLKKEYCKVFEIFGLIYNTISIKNCWKRSNCFYLTPINNVHALHFDDQIDDERCVAETTIQIIQTSIDHTIITTVVKLSQTKWTIFKIFIKTSIINKILWNDSCPFYSIKCENLSLVLDCKQLMEIEFNLINNTAWQKLIKSLYP